MSSSMSAKLKKKPWSKSSKSDDNESIKSANSPAEAKSSSTAKSSTRAKSSATHTIPTAPSVATRTISVEAEPAISLLANSSAPMSSVSDGPGDSRKDTIHMKDREGLLSIRPVRSVLPGQLTSTAHNNGPNAPVVPPRDSSLKRSNTKYLKGNTEQTQISAHYAAQSSTALPGTSSWRPPSPSPERVPLQVRKTSPEPANVRYINPYEGYSKEPNTPEPMGDDSAGRSQADILQWYLFKSYRLELLKGYYQQMAKKVEQLESQLALKSMDGTRRILDDSAYIARFHLLDKNLAQFAFQWRTQWTKYPGWIEQFNLNQEPKLKKIQARAFLTEWLVNEVFNKVLHPGLKLQESLILKDIERNIIANNERKLSSEPKDDVVRWRTATLKARLDPNFLNHQGERDALKKTLHYRDHRRAVLASFGDYFSASLDRQLIGPDGSMNESFLTGLDSIIEEVLTLISFISLETRNIAVYLIPPGSMYSNKRMRVPEDVPEPREGTEISLCAFLGVQKDKDGQAAVLYQPEVYFRK
ncbi:hypothetical protein V1505DRAFT_375760 [Lipomyces doorenjongii]